MTIDRRRDGRWPPRRGDDAGTIPSSVSSAREEEIDLVVRVRIEGRQRPNLKSEDSGLGHRFSEAKPKVSLWMCENGTGHEESRGPTRR